MEINEKISQMLERIDSLTPKDKGDIKKMATAAGLDVKFGGKCGNCYVDALLLLRKHYGVQQEAKGVETVSGNFLFTASAQVRWWYKGMSYTLSPMTSDATIERYIAVNPKQKIYIKKGGE